MAHVEPMDIDDITNDYEDKENSIHHSNVLPKIPCTEKGYEELDISEIGMKLRYSITPASSPMSRSYTTNCKDNKNLEDANSSLNIGDELTSSLNSTLTNSDINKASNVYPLQALPTDNSNDMNRNVLIPKPLDTEDNNITVTLSDNIDETFSIPSTSSSLPHTPEAVTPTKELPKDGGSPIMRGLRSVLSMFKPQSPQPSYEQSSQDSLQIHNTINKELQYKPVDVSTPLHTTNRNSPKRTSPFKDSLVFNEDLEKELQWKDDSTILFKEEKIPKHKLYLQESVASNLESKILNKTKEECNQTLEYMDISHNDTLVNDKTITDLETEQHAVLEVGGLESDGEFVDCETTYTKDDIESQSKSKENISMQFCEQHISLEHLEVNTIDSTIDLCTSNSKLAIECVDLPPHTSNDIVSNIGILNKHKSANSNFGTNNCLEAPFSLIHSNERSLCETKLQVKSVMNINETVVNNNSASNIEVNQIDIIKMGSGHNTTDTLQCKGEIKDNHESGGGLQLLSINNELECKESCIDDLNDHKIITLIKDDVKTNNLEVNNCTNTDTVQFNFAEEGSKSKEAVHIHISKKNHNLSKIDNPIICNTTHLKTTEVLISGVHAINMKSTVSEESNKEIDNDNDRDSLLQTNNESLENNLSNNLPVNIGREISTQNNNVEHGEYAESPYENKPIKSAENEFHDVKITLPNLEVDKKLPNNIPLPTDDFNKETDTLCKANKIPGDTENNNESEIAQSLNINVNDGLEKVPEAIKTMSMERNVNQISDLVIYETKPTESAEICNNLVMPCNKGSEKNNFIENAKKDEEVDKLVLLESEKHFSTHEVINSKLIDDVIEEIPKTFDSDSLQPSNACEAIKLNFSIQCDTNSNIKRLDGVTWNSNMEQLSNPFEINNKLEMSPPLINKGGYDIDFDNIEDPFATKTKIRESPTPDGITGKFSLTKEDQKSLKVSPKINKSNKRKSRPIKKPTNTKNNSLNSTFDTSMKNECKESIQREDLTVATFDSTFNTDSISLTNTAYKFVNNPDMEIENKTLCKADNKKNIIEDGHNLTSEPTQRPPPRNITKSVFNCPEINDINFCSFSDKQKISSADLIIASEEITVDNEECLKQKIDLLESISPEAINDQHLMVEVLSETSVSKESKSSDVKEVNTEDEDTATFNETTEFIESDKENFSSIKSSLAFEVADTVIDNDNAGNGEMFIDAEAFEFLLNQNKTNVIADSGKESLFLKFDPLYTKRVSSDGIIPALKRVQNNQSTPKKLTKLQLETASEMPGPSQKETLDDEASIQAMSKPMMVVNPAINSIVSPKKAATPKVSRQSLTFTSPAMAVIDKLLSLSGNSLNNDHNITPVSSPVRQHNETDIALNQLREMLADKDIHVHNLRSESQELKDRLYSLEEQVKSLEIESAERLKKVNDLNERLLEKTKMNKSMANVVEEYERTIVSLIAQIEQEKKNNAEEKIVLIKERDEQTAHLASMEVSFNDLHSKYEKSKQLIYSMKANEETYKKSMKEFKESLSKMQNNYELLKQHATSKLNHANLELEKLNRAHEAEVLKLNALIKRKELHISSLEETLAQKTKANEELTSICDELINKVG